MMFFPSAMLIHSVCFVLAIVIIQSSFAATDRISSNHRVLRTTKFPRIGRSPFDSEETPFIVDINTSSSSEEKLDEDQSSDHEFHSIDQRSVLFPRIGKRAFHNLLWANALSNPHRMVDAQGRYYLNGYDYNIHPSRPQFQSRYRGKRNVQM